MNYGEFILTVGENKPPAQLNKYLKILWYDSEGKWDVAHNLAQAIYNRHGSLLHAYLHRKEGDFANAAYWYSNADTEMPTNPLNEEWEDLVRKYLNFNKV
jgi:hypothetical protein